MGTELRGIAYKYLTAFHLVAGILLLLVQTYGMPENAYETSVYVTVGALAALVYRKDKDTKTILEKLNLTPQQEFTIKQAIELILDIVGFTPSLEKIITPPVPVAPTKDNIIAGLKAEIAKREEEDG